VWELACALASAGASTAGPFFIDKLIAWACRRPSWGRHRPDVHRWCAHAMGHVTDEPAPAGRVCAATGRKFTTTPTIRPFSTLFGARPLAAAGIAGGPGYRRWEKWIPRIESRQKQCAFARDHSRSDGQDRWTGSINLRGSWRTSSPPGSVLSGKSPAPSGQTERIHFAGNICVGLVNNLMSRGLKDVDAPQAFFYQEVQGHSLAASSSHLAGYFCPLPDWPTPKITGLSFGHTQIAIRRKPGCWGRSRLHLPGRVSRRLSATLPGTGTGRLAVDWPLGARLARDITPPRPARAGKLTLSWRRVFKRSALTSISGYARLHGEQKVARKCLGFNCDDLAA